MTTALYTALVARFGKPAVDAALVLLRCEWRRDPAHGSMRLCCDFSAEGCSYTGALPDPAATVLLESVEAKLAGGSAEVIRLRERDAAWEWLAAWLGTNGRWVTDHGDCFVAYIGWDQDNAPIEAASTPLVDFKPDPVALCDALDANWRGVE